jgi:3-hydroxyacyl-[acyl-carrier-protein] dehydratase
MENDMTADALVPDLTTLNYDRPLFGIEDIRFVNPQRYEMEMLSGIVYLDPTRHVIIGFKDMRADEFWTRGHMPGYPLFPGVLMCEAGAQLCGFYYTHQKVGVPGGLLGLAVIDEARFVRPVRPGDRLVLVGVGVKVHRRLTRFRVVGYVGTEKAFETVVGGTPLGKLEDLRGA